MIERIVELSIEHRKAVLIATFLLALLGFGVSSELAFDALPDVTGNSVVVLTRAAGFNPEEVEQLVTRPVEIRLGALPGTVGQRSVSRFGISAVTVLFDEATPMFLARQLVSERLAGVGAELPPGAELPELGPLSGGLGEIFQLTVSSATRSPSELLTITMLDLAPVFRRVPGVVEVNPWGGRRRTVDIILHPERLAPRKLTVESVRAALEGEFRAVPGNTLVSGDRQVFLRGTSLSTDPAELGRRLIRPGVFLSDIATIEEGHEPRTGAATRDGRGETVYVMLQMLRGANALEVLERVKAVLPEARAALPPDMRMELVYDRSVLVHRTLRTVFTNLAEGGLLVVIVLFLMLGNTRAGLLVASSIPLSMLGATTGMVLLGVPGNLMSLGAIDFGLLVDGAVVMVESVYHRFSTSSDPNEPIEARVKASTLSVARPVFYSVLIILVVYIPILSLTGVDGALFRPMALTVVLALTTSLLLVLTFVPAACAVWLRAPSQTEVEPWLVRGLRRSYDPLLDWSLGHPRAVTAGGAVLLALAVVLFARAETTFVPQLDEGSLVIQTTRRPDITIEAAVRASNELEAAVLKAAPEVRSVASRIGSPAVATDLMGLEQADIFVEIAPRSEWRDGLTREALIEGIEHEIDGLDRESEVSFTQPIQMRFNELVGGETTDVALSIYGPDLERLRGFAERASSALAAIPGVDDARILAPPEVALVEVVPDPFSVAAQGLSSGEVLDAVQALRNGLHVATAVEDRQRIPIRLRLFGPESELGLEQVLLPVESGSLVPLHRLAEVRRRPVPSLVSHEDGLRRIVVGFNVRGRALGTVVEDARAAFEKAVDLPAPYRAAWKGQYESLVEARERMALVVPVSLLLILGLLLLAFRALGPALLILLNVPFAAVGGIIALTVRDLPLSISALIGFIALSGIAVLNGVVMTSRLRGLLLDGVPAAEAARRAARSRLRPVMMTALVAALGFVPMMLATGVGAEVQRPLATVVVGGLLSSTLLTLVILPTWVAWLGDRRSRPRA